MNIVRFNPFRTVRPTSFDHLLDDFFGNGLSEFFNSDTFAGTPSVNVIETDSAFEIEIAAPGLSKEDFTVEADNDRLTISVQKEDKESEKVDGKFTRREFNYSKFSRSFHLSEDINKDEITASYRDGVLKLNLAKNESVITPPSRGMERK